MKRNPADYNSSSASMSENASSNDAPLNKRPRGAHDDNRFEFRLLVPTKVAGSIIGKGGCNIQKLRQDNSATVRIPDCPGPERTMSVTCADSATAVQVLEQTIPFMCEAERTSNLEIRILIHQSIAGGVIGRAGFKIKEIRDESGAAVKVYQSCAPRSTDRCVSIQGDSEKICKAAAEVFKIICDTEIKGVENQYDPFNFDAYYAHEYGGFGADDSRDRRGGGGGRGGRDHGGRDHGGDRRRPQGGFGGGGGGGSGGSRFGRRDNYGGGGGRHGGGGGHRGRDGGRGFDGDGFGFGQSNSGGAGGNFAEDGGDQETTQVTIPNDVTGAIIGPGGSRIRKIRNDSQASITIAEPVDGVSDRIITIVGNRRQIQTAQYLLQQSVRENAPGDNGARAQAY